MSFRTEWMTADPAVLLFTPGTYVDADAQVAEDWCLTLSNGDDVAFEGSLDDIAKLAENIMFWVTAARKTEGSTS